MAPGQFEGKFLVSMPEMSSDIFSQSVVYMCLHNEEGALGFVVNKPAPMSLRELFTHAEVASSDTIVTPAVSSDEPVQTGGPVDPNRGFVLHSPDYTTDATVAVSPEIALSSTVSVLRSIAINTGPENSAIMLGYSGWGAGQLEQEILDNAWLVADLQSDLVFDTDHETKYARALSHLGLNAANFQTVSGRA
ncbi:MAG: YqgE/AlgH family protein [Pseudomonadota bacterium]